MAEKCRGAGWGCLDCKRVLADNMIRALAPVRERALALQERPDQVDEILADGAAAARRIASETLREVRDHMGFMPARAITPSEASDLAGMGRIPRFARDDRGD